MWEPLKRYSMLPPEARRTFRRATVLLYVVRISLRLRGYTKTQQWLQSRLDLRPRVTSFSEDNSVCIERICHMVSAAERYSPGQPTCLDESLLLWYLLRRQNICAEMRIGVRKQGGKFEAHAWVENNGVALNQRDEQHRLYAPFDGDLQQSSEENG